MDRSCESLVRQENMLDERDHHIQNGTLEVQVWSSRKSKKPHSLYFCLSQWICKMQAKIVTADLASLGKFFSIAVRPAKSSHKARCWIL